MKIKDLKIEDFLDELASKSPTPGGGAVAAVTGAMGAALVEMVTNLSQADSLKLIADSAKELREKLLNLADEDVAAFDAVMAAYKLAKEQGDRKQQIKEALEEATKVPVETMLLSRKVLKLAKKTARYGNPNALSDSRTAAHLARAAIASAKENIKINQKALKRLEA